MHFDCVWGPSVTDVNASPHPAAVLRSVSSEHGRPVECDSFIQEALDAGCCGGDRSLKRCGHAVSDFLLLGQLPPSPPWVVVGWLSQSQLLLIQNMRFILQCWLIYFCHRQNMLQQQSWNLYMSYIKKLKCQLYCSPFSHTGCSWYCTMYIHLSVKGWPFVYPILITLLLDLILHFK